MRLRTKHTGQPEPRQSNIPLPFQVRLVNALNSGPFYRQHTCKDSVRIHQFHAVIYALIKSKIAS